MSHYMIQWSYKESAMAALVRKPSDRSKVVEDLFQAFGGKLLQYYLAFGEYDGVAIAEFPSNEAMTAALLTIGRSGAVSRTKTTVLITPAEAVRAMKKARGAKTGFRAPK